MVCTCGLLKLQKAGRHDRGGVEHCNSCQRPIEVGTVYEPVRSAPPVPSSMLTTLHELLGFRTVRNLGVVTELAATSGLTATIKGNAALDAAMRNLGASAGRMSANAVLGVSATPFGAGGGITSAFGGDAVGVLLIGTAVVVEPIDAGSTT